MIGLLDWIQPGNQPSKLGLVPGIKAKCFGILEEQPASFLELPLGTALPYLATGQTSIVVLFICYQAQMLRAKRYHERKGRFHGGKG